MREIKHCDRSTQYILYDIIFDKNDYCLKNHLEFLGYSCDWVDSMSMVSACDLWNSSCWLAVQSSSQFNKRNKGTYIRHACFLDTTKMKINSDIIKEFNLMPKIDSFYNFFINVSKLLFNQQIPNDSKIVKHDLVKL